MGVSHLRRDAGIASSQVARGNTKDSPQSQQVTSGTQFKRPAETSGTRQVPVVGSVGAFEDKSLHPSNTTSQPPKGNSNGGRAGSKSGQEKIGTRKGNNHPVSGAAMY